MHNKCKVAKADSQKLMRLIRNISQLSWLEALLLLLAAKHADALYIVYMKVGGSLRAQD